MKKLLSKLKSLKAPIGITLMLIALGLASTQVIKPDSYLERRVVRLTSTQGGSCSGEQVRAPSGVDYILTAGHCNVLADKDKNIMVITEKGKMLMRRIIAEDPHSDLMLLEGLPNLKGLDVALYSEPKEHIRTFTHGAALDTYKTEGVLIQDKKIMVLLKFIRDEADEESCPAPKAKVMDLNLGFFTVKLCVLDVVETVHTAMTVPGSSGGMIVNDYGNLVGVVSAGGEGFSYMVPTKMIRTFLSGY